MEKFFNYSCCLGLIFVRFRFGWFGMTHLKHFKTFKDLIPDNQCYTAKIEKALTFYCGRDELVAANVLLYLGCSALIRNLLYFQSNSSLSQSESWDT